MELHSVVDPILRRFDNDEITEGEAQKELEVALTAAGMQEALYYIFVTLRVLKEQKEEKIEPDKPYIM